MKKMFHPELDEEESVVRPFLKQLLEASLLFRELVVDLPDVHRLQIGVAVARVGLADVHKQVLVELEQTKNAQQEMNGAKKNDTCPVC